MHLGRPLRGEGDAADHAHHDEDGVTRAEHGDEGAAEAAVERHDAHADVLEEDGELEEEVAEGVELRDGDADLQGQSWSVDLYGGALRVDGDLTLRNSTNSSGAMVSMCRPLPYTTAAVAS